MKKQGEDPYIHKQDVVFSLAGAEAQFDFVAKTVWQRGPFGDNVVLDKSSVTCQ